MYEIEISDQDGVALIPIDNLTGNDELIINIYNYCDQFVDIDVTISENKSVEIEKLEISTANSINIKFLTKKYPLKIKNLIFKCSGIQYLGGADVRTSVKNEPFCRHLKLYWKVFNLFFIFRLAVA